MSHYKPYPAYKDSGVEWLGRVPGHWEVSPLRYVVTFRSGGTPSKEKLEYWDGDIPWASAKDLKKEQLEDTQDHLTELAVASGAASLVPAGSVLVVVRGMILARIFPVAEALVPMAINQDLKALHASSRLKGRFLAHLLRGLAAESLSRLEEAGHGTKALRMEAWTSMQLTVPPKEEQCAILSRLDRETARIDALVEKKTRFIELLREKRQALITHAVTQGLDPNVKMKDSGVEWLGEVPEHWDVLQLRHTAQLESGHTPSRSKPEYWVDCNVPWFTLADVWQVRSGEQKYVSETSEKVSQLGLENSSARLLPAGSVFLSRTASVGFPGIMKVDMATSQDFAVWTCSDELFNEYLYYVLLGMKPDFDRLMMGSTHKTIYMPDIEAIRIARPPVDEQQYIVSALSDQLGRFKAVIEKTERSIELLKERRSALITAAVTGQIDLRESA